MSCRWLFLVLASSVACGDPAAAPNEAVEEPVEMGALPEEVSEFMAEGRQGLLADGASVEVMVPFRYADGRWEDAPVVFSWNNGEDVPTAGAICPAGSEYLGTSSATVSASACMPLAAANAAKEAANDAIMLDCLNEAMDYCAPDLGAGIANDASPTVTSNVISGTCGAAPFAPPRWLATAVASAPCCAECEELPF